MPTYQYHCNDCGNDFEVFQKFSESSLTRCDRCNGSLRKVFNPVGVVFKGSGFYATDNRTQGKHNAATASDHHAADKSTKTTTTTSTDSGSSSATPAKAAS